MKQLLLVCCLTVLAGCGPADDTSPPKKKAAVTQQESGTTVSFSGYRENFSITRTDKGPVIVTNKLTGETKSYPDIKLLKFFDKNISFDVDGPEGQVYRLYQAAFDRKPDAGGLGFWIYARSGGVSAADIANGFIQSQEFQSLYGKDVANEKFISLLYQNILHRAPETGGYDFWITMINQGVPRADVLNAFSEGDENKGNLTATMNAGFDYVPFAPGAPIVPHRSSYENKNNIAIDSRFPGVWDPSMENVRKALDATELGFNPRSLSFGDFMQDGTYSAFVVTNRFTNLYPNDNHARLPDAPGIARFLQKGADGKWIDVTPQLVQNPADRLTCVTSSYSIVADFNNDAKPDVYLACTGIDFQLGGKWTNDQLSNQHIFLSQSDGKYRHEVIADSKIYGHQATAFDVDGDGRVDVVSADAVAHRSPLIFWGNGDGTFRKDLTPLPADMKDKAIYGVVGVPVDGKMHLVVSGNTPGAGTSNYGSEYGTTILTYESGAFVYKHDLTPNLPKTADGFKFGLGLDHIYRNGYLYSYHVSNAYEIDGIVKTDLASGKAQLIYSRRIGGFGEQLVEIFLRQDGKLVVFGALCNSEDNATSKFVCAYEIDS